jgi:hypothetical protein
MKRVINWVGKQVLAIAIYGGIFLAVLGIVLALAVYAGTKADASSKQFAIDSLRILSNQWNVDSLKTLATPQLLNQIAKSPDEFVHGMNHLSSLGPLFKVNQIEGQAFVQYNIGKENVTTASYRANAAYGRGNAYISMCLQLIQDQWRVDCITVDKVE